MHDPITFGLNRNPRGYLQEVTASCYSLTAALSSMK
jgi:hypothetical protein